MLFLLRRQDLDEWYLIAFRRCCGFSEREAVLLRFVASKAGRCVNTQRRLYEECPCILLALVPVVPSRLRRVVSHRFLSVLRLLGTRSCTAAVSLASKAGRCVESEARVQVVGLPI